MQELSNGFSTPDSDAQTLFMVLEGGVIGLATLLLVVFHPGPVFGEEWRTTGFFSKHKKDEDVVVGPAVQLEEHGKVRTVVS